MKKSIFLLAALFPAIPLLSEETSNVDYGQITTPPVLDLIWKFDRDNINGVPCATITGVAVTSGENPTGDITVPMSLVCADNTPLIVKKIAAGAFANQIGITSISMPVTIEQVGAGAFTGCTVLSAIEVDAGNPWFTTSAGALYDKDHTKIIACPARTETIQLPITLTEIDAKAFANCHRLLSLNVPASVTKIGARAFKDCTRLSSITFEGNAPTADPSIVEGANVSLVFYKEPESTGWDASPWNVLNVQDSTGEQPSGIVQATAGRVTWHYRVINGEAEIYNNGTAAIPTSTSETYTYDPEHFVWVGDGRLVIPSSLDGYPVTRIGDYAFSGCSALDIVSIPKSVRKIGYHPFSGAAITTLDLPDSLRTLDGNPLAGCDTALSVTISADNSYYAVVNGILYDKDIRTLVGCPARSESVSIPATVTQIGPEAFDGCFRLRAMTLPDSLVSVGASAFRDATRLASVVFPASLAELEGPGLFEGCSSLLKVTYAGNAPEADDNIYLGTPETLTSYASSTATGFSGDSWKGRPLVLTGGGTDPNPHSFDTIDGLTWYYRVVDGVAEIYRDGACAVESNPENAIVGSLALPTTLGGYVVKGVGDGALTNLRGITFVNVPDTYEWIGDSVFSNCTSLASVALGDGVERIGHWPFYGTKLTSLTIPDSVSAIDGNPVAGASLMQTVVVADTQPCFSTEDGLLYDKKQKTLIACPATKTSISLPSTLQTINDDAFYGCNFIDDLSTTSDDAVWTYAILNGQATITELSGASGVVTIPASLNGYPVSEIADGAFVNCATLTAFTSKSPAFSTKHGILYSADGSELICVPASTTLPYTIITTNTAIKVTTHLEAGIKGSVPNVNKTTTTNAPTTKVTKKAMPGDISFSELLNGVTRIRGYAFCGVNLFEASCTTNTTSEGNAYLNNSTANADSTSTITIISTSYRSEITINRATTTVDANAFTYSGLTCIFSAGAGNVPPPSIGGTALSDAYSDSTAISMKEIFASRNRDAIKAANALLASCPDAFNIVWADGILSAKIAKKGKVSISGMLTTGKKVSTTCQILIYEDWLCIPVSLPKTSISFLIWISREDGSLVVEGLGDAVAGMPGTLADGAAFRIDADAVANMLVLSLSAREKNGEPLIDEIPDGVGISQKGSKLSVAANTSSLKLRYTAKTGSIKGSFRAYYMLNGKRKSKTVTITGVMIDGVGYGHATLKKANPVPVEIW